jgi:pimeloyl-ACP methyl ester carboxylesterase
MVAKSDRVINPNLERMYAKRANSKVIEIDNGSHAVYVSHPNEVARLIMAASKQ